MKMSSILLKLFFEYFRQQNKTKIQLSVHFSVCIKNVTNIKLIKILIWDFKAYLFG